MWVARAVLLLVVAAGGLLVVADLLMRQAQTDPAPAIAAHFAPMRDDLRDMAVVGFVADRSFEAEYQRRYYMAASMLVPVVVVSSDQQAVVIACFEDDSKLSDYQRASGMLVWKSYGPGIAILRREGR